MFSFKKKLLKNPVQVDLAPVFTEHPMFSEIVYMAEVAGSCRKIYFKELEEPVQTKGWGLCTKWRSGVEIDSICHC